MTDQKLRVRVLPILRNSAQYAPHCMACGKKNDGTLVLAHSNELRLGRGSHFKTPDYFGAIVCYECHTDIDSNRKMSREERRDIQRKAHSNTLTWWFENGWLQAEDGLKYVNVPF